MKVSGPEDFIAIVPYLLGFHPVDSVVALFFDGGRVALTARLDLPADADTPPTTAELADQITGLARHSRARTVVLVCYTGAERRRPDLVQLAADVGVRLIEALQVHPQRWWSLICDDSDCCPGLGTPYDLRGHPLCAEAVLAGLTAVPDRAAVAELVAGPPEADLPRLEQLGADALLAVTPMPQAGRQRLMLHRVERALEDPAALSDGECAELAALCVDLAVRDVAWALMTRDEAPAHLDLWRRVVSRTVDWLSPGPLGLESLAAWISGNGALLNCGIERLEAVKPEYGLLWVLRDLSWRALPPSTWDEMAPAMRAELNLVPS